MQNQRDQNVKCRINKYLSMSGICSRRDADKLIEQGLVTINGRRAEPGDRVGEGDTVLVGKRKACAEQKKVVLAFYKPVGIVCTERDRHAEKKITDMIHYPIRVTYAGRLDKDSEGLILLSNDGELIQKMMRAAEKHEKEYIVKTDKEITDDFIQKMSDGIYLRELDVTTRPCKVLREGKYTFRIILTQGVNRQIRRMCGELGFQVTALKRVRVMSVGLSGLQPGKYRELTDTELSLLYEECGLER